MEDAETMELRFSKPPPGTYKHLGLKLNPATVGRLKEMAQDYYGRTMTEVLTTLIDNHYADLGLGSKGKTKDSE